MAQLFLDQFHIDTQRCQLSRGDDVVTLEPKVMKVFECLARHQGEVVSHQTLLDEIWGNSVVDPSALQRCIAQLRKAFRDDARQQRVIATYPKNGYSLLIPVTTGRISALIPPFRPAPALAASIVLAVLITLVITGTYRFYQQPDSSPVASGQNPAAGLKADFFAVYSPDGLRVAYPRQHEDGGQHLWIRDLVSGEEFQLTRTAAAYVDPAWSPDSRHLAVLSTARDDCSDLLLLQVPMTAGQELLPADTLIKCHQGLHSPQWLDQEALTYIDNSTPDSRIRRIGLQSRQVSTLYRDSEKQFRHMSYSVRAGRLALSMMTRDQQPQIMLLNFNTGSELMVTLPDNLAAQDWRPIWNPQANGLVIATGSGVYQINLDGRLTQQRSPFLPENPSQHY